MKKAIAIMGLLSLGGMNSALADVAQGDCNGSGEPTPVTIQDVICTINIVLGTAVPPLPADGSALNPTGIAFGGDQPSGNNPSCTGVNIAAQDCAHEGNRPFDFTKLAADGSPLAIQGADWALNGAGTSDIGSEAAGTKWSCVRDNHTGLVWEVKTNDGGVHDKDKLAQWGGDTAIGKNAASQFGTYYDDADWNDLITVGNAGSGLCGNTGWRMPTREELRSIVHYGKVNPSIDSHYFPNTVSGFYWSASPYADDSSVAWRLSFSRGYDVANYRFDPRRVRLVRTGP